MVARSTELHIRGRIYDCSRFTLSWAQAAHMLTSTEESIYGPLDRPTGRRNLNEASSASHCVST